MRIGGLPQQPKVSQAQPRSSAPRTTGSTDESRDVVEISPQSVADLTALAKSTPADSTTRLQDIRARIHSGEYDTPETRRRIADAVLSSPSMDGVLQDVAQAQVARQGLQNVPDVRESSVAQARERVESGYYDSPEVRQATASRILDELA